MGRSWNRGKIKDKVLGWVITLAISAGVAFGIYSLVESCNDGQIASCVILLKGR